MTFEKITGLTLKEAFESGFPYKHETHHGWYEKFNPAPMNVHMAIDSHWETKTGTTKQCDHCKGLGIVEAQ